MIDKKTILIIGAKSDIAIAIAQKFASDGYNLQLAGRDIGNLEVFSKDIKIKHAVDIYLYELDILHYESFPGFISSLNVLPDIALCAVGLLGNQKEDENNINNSSLLIRTNYEGPSLFLGEIANHFEKRRSGSIIGISSVAGERGSASNYIYGSSKAGFTSFLSGLRNRLHKSNVQVLTVLPGFVATKMTDHLKLPYLITSKPEKIAITIIKNKENSKQIFIFPWGEIISIIKFIPESIFKRLEKL